MPLTPPARLRLKTKYAAIGAFPVIGYVPDGERIEAVLLAEPAKIGLRPVGRSIRIAGVLNGGS